MENFIRKNRYLFSLISAYLIWGSLPLYFYFTNFVRPIDLMMYRILASFFIVTIFILSSQKIGPLLKEVLSNPDYKWSPITGIVIGCNWCIYLLGLKNGHAIEISLGYFVSPILTIFLSIFFYLEKLNKLQLFSLFLTSLGIVTLVLFHGSFPVYAFYVACTFSAYVLLKKRLNVNPVTAMWLELCTLFPFAAAGLFYQIDAYGGVGFAFTPAHVLNLLIGGMITFLPILLLTIGLRKVSLTLVGSLQYISPTCQFLFGVFLFDSQFSLNDFFAYCIVWFSIILFVTTTAKKQSQ